MAVGTASLHSHSPQPACSALRALWSAEAGCGVPWGAQVSSGFCLLGCREKESGLAWEWWV